jgi:serine/threonine protein kinase
MGAVYLGWQKSLRRLVAIKILPPELDDNAANFAERFQREAHAMARFSHPGIVAVYDAGATTDGLFYFIMEYIEGTDVQKMVRVQGPLSAEQALAITMNVCDALAYAHKRGVIHRDIKPSNIMVDTEGHVKVADFGLAKLANDDSAALITGSHVSMGTPDFMAPEALYGIGKVDHRADLYAVGVMLYQMLTGEVPRGRFDLPSVQRAGLDPRFDAIVDRAMQKNPDKRYTSATEIRTDLDRILTEPIPFRSVERPEPPGPIPPKPDSPLTTPLASEPTQSGVAESRMQEDASIPAVLTTPESDPSPGSPPHAMIASETARRESVAKRSPAMRNTAVVAAISIVIATGVFLGSNNGRWRDPKTANDRPREPGTPTSLPPAPPQRPETISRTDSPQPEAPPSPSAMATQAAPFVNGLDMKFVPVPITGGPTGGQRILFSIWETRVQDYQLFVQEKPRIWLKPESAQGPTHPVIWISWDDAQAFCAWLTERERKAGRIAANEVYRLPTDHEWSCAVGIGDREDPLKLPGEKSGKISGVFPWGDKWPPPPGAGNYSGVEAVGHETSKEQGHIAGYNDGFASTSPVGSFAPNGLGLFDLGGNAWEWCQDWYDQDQQRRVARGAAFDYDTRGTLLSSYRARGAPTYIGFGFRCVLAADAPPASVAVPSPIEFLTSPAYEWSKPENLSPSVNSTKDDYSPALTDDGLLLIFSSSRNGPERLFECRRKSPGEPFDKAVPIKELDSSGEESGAFLTGDGLTLLYHSTQGRNHHGGSDIYQSHRRSRETPWEQPTNLGTTINTAAAEEAPCLSPDGLTLLFHSNRAGGQGGYDLWRSRRKSLDAPFETPANLGKGVNTDGKEFSPCFVDSRNILFVRSTEKSPHKLFLATSDANGAFVSRSIDLPVTGGIQSPTLSPDGRTLYFASDMPGGQGGWDLWQIHRVLKAGAPLSQPATTSPPFPTATPAADSSPAASIDLIQSITSSTVLPDRETHDEGVIHYDPKNVIDGRIDTAWVANSRHSGIGDWLEIQFKVPVQFKTISIFGSYGKNADLFRKNARVKRLRLSTDTGNVSDLDFEDRQDFQRFKYSPASVVRWIRLEILGVYPGDMYQDTPISEVRFQ